MGFFSKFASKHSGGNSKDYKQRVRDLLNHYQPEKIGYADQLLGRHEGKEKELLKELTKKFGPEPAVAANEKKKDEPVDYKQQVRDLLQRSCPEKPGYADQLLGRHQGKEKELLAELEKKFGKAPPPPPPQAASAAAAASNNSSSSGSPAVVGADDNENLPARVRAMVAHYAPARAATVDGLLTKYGGKEKTLLNALINQYGPEPPPGAAAPPSPSSPADAAADATDAGITASPSSSPRSVKEPSSSPTTVATAPSAAPSPKQEGEQQQQQPARDGPSSSSSSSSPSSPTAAAAVAVSTAEVSSSPQQDEYKQRVRNLLLVKAPEKPGYADQLLSRHVGKERDLLEELVKKFGKEPSSSSPKKLQKQLKDPVQRVKNLLIHYQPDKPGYADQLLAKHKGKEKQLLDELVKKFGPEPEAPKTAEESVRAAQAAAAIAAAAAEMKIFERIIIKRNRDKIESAWRKELDELQVQFEEEAKKKKNIDGCELGGGAAAAGPTTIMADEDIELENSNINDYKDDDAAAREEGELLLPHADDEPLTLPPPVASSSAVAAGESSSSNGRTLPPADSDIELDDAGAICNHITPAAASPSENFNNNNTKRLSEYSNNADADEIEELFENTEIAEAVLQKRRDEHKKKKNKKKRKLLQRGGGVLEEYDDDDDDDDDDDAVSSSGSEVEPMKWKMTEPEHKYKHTEVVDDEFDDMSVEALARDAAKRVSSSPRRRGGGQHQRRHQHREDMDNNNNNNAADDSDDDVCDDEATAGAMLELSQRHDAEVADADDEVADDAEVLVRIKKFDEDDDKNLGDFSEDDSYSYVTPHRSSTYAGRKIKPVNYVSSRGLSTRVPLVNINQDDLRQLELPPDRRPSWAYMNPALAKQKKQQEQQALGLFSKEELRELEDAPLSASVPAMTLEDAHALSGQSPRSVSRTFGRAAASSSSPEKADVTTMMTRDAFGTPALAPGASLDGTAGGAGAVPTFSEFDEGEAAQYRIGQDPVVRPKSSSSSIHNHTNSGNSTSSAATYSSSRQQRQQRERLRLLSQSDEHLREGTPYNKNEEDNSDVSEYRRRALQEQQQQAPRIVRGANAVRSGFLMDRSRAAVAAAREDSYSPHDSASNRFKLPPELPPEADADLDSHFQRNQDHYELPPSQRGDAASGSQRQRTSGKADNDDDGDDDGLDDELRKLLLEGARGGGRGASTETNNRATSSVSVDGGNDEEHRRGSQNGNNSSSPPSSSFFAGESLSASSPERRSLTLAELAELDAIDRDTVAHYDRVQQAREKTLEERTVKPWDLRTFDDAAQEELKDFLLFQSPAPAPAASSSVSFSPPASASSRLSTAAASPEATGGAAAAATRTFSGQGGLSPGIRDQLRGLTAAAAADEDRDAGQRPRDGEWPSWATGSSGIAGDQHQHQQHQQRPSPSPRSARYFSDHDNINNNAAPQHHHHDQGSGGPDYHPHPHHSSPARPASSPHHRHHVDAGGGLPPPHEGEEEALFDSLGGSSRRSRYSYSPPKDEPLPSSHRMKSDPTFLLSSILDAPTHTDAVHNADVFGSPMVKRL